eukprot:4354459-Pyramimonas_sp.AAC.1
MAFCVPRFAGDPIRVRSTPIPRCDPAQIPARCRAAVGARGRCGPATIPGWCQTSWSPPRL